MDPLERAHAVLARAAAASSAAAQLDYTSAPATALLREAPTALWTRLSRARVRLLREGVKRIAEQYAGVAVSSRGTFVPPGRAPPPGERRLYLLIEGRSAPAVRGAKAEARRVLEEEAMRLGAHVDRGGKYSAV